ncbi:MAG: hypothetical protein R2728_04040 [Chitinophagales bacterium]
MAAVQAAELENSLQPMASINGIRAKSMKHLLLFLSGTVENLLKPETKTLLQQSLTPRYAVAIIVLISSKNFPKLMANDKSVTVEEVDAEV